MESDNDRKSHTMVLVYLGTKGAHVSDHSLETLF